MSIFSSMNIGATALTAERTRLDIIAKNIANAQTTRTKSGQPYRRQVAVFEEVKKDPSFKSIFESKKMGTKSGVSGGVEVVGVVEDRSPFQMKYEPGHPDADENGYVKMSNVDMITEMVDMITAQRAYEANVTSINTSKAMIQKAMEIAK
ncbi:flagellar basal body rod protein FlgC [Criibacterium bergeronii]|uniref:Flagellar basal-body rod protein FlgC n=1 Tax=Criibacterium bergeronii TaxID=1871336 RepID=A0A371INT2_9FIRM|nr:flagellar basal body rod protein FlgC [Criibacterium bergeronii]MBS6062398.1 flagellar basal body rod protein FlgC [Peptostreptococcaceae bacterium]RDY22148.1 flagellar basal body rod protein FlgC [Criibacterium bergeronii]TRW28653.1 flagellar basal body rod protein FlgC [Criibacterium bergeronii]